MLVTCRNLDFNIKIENVKSVNYSPLSLPLAYCSGLLLSILLKLWLLRFRFEEPWALLLLLPLPAAGTLEGPGNL